jgi:ABC-type proline/glycine betaine transport system permease subunit
MKCPRFHHILWTLYYALSTAGFGFGMAVFVGVKGNPTFAILIAAITIGVLVLFFKRFLHGW